MNLVDGKILETKDCGEVLDTLEMRVLDTLSKPRLSPELVIEACAKLVSSLEETDYLSAMAEFGIPDVLGRSYVAEARAMFFSKALHRRMLTELGDGYNQSPTYVQASEGIMVKQQLLPLGVLLHVATGNADGLPAFSVLEGLLTGNINILKLPSAEGGVSIRLLQELIQIEPSLSEYIYVFDYSSKDITNINRLVDVADAVVLWGGIEAVSGFRAMLPPNVKLIEWGHKVSFAYVTKDCMEDERLSGIAQNMVSTGQILCSSCQGIFIDTEDMEDVFKFCEHFLPILEATVLEYSGNVDIGIKAQAALEEYSAELESVFNSKRIFKGKDCSLTASNDRILESAIGLANAWVKPLPQSMVLDALRPYKNYLQTAALICDEEDTPNLTDRLSKTGVVRICPGERMSETYSGAPHDGEYPLRRYTKVMTVEE